MMGNLLYRSSNEINPACSLFIRRNILESQDWVCIIYVHG